MPRLGISVEVSLQDADKLDSEAQSVLQELLGRKEVIAVGPLQLDASHALPMEKQEALFIQLAKSAKEGDVPVLVHSGLLPTREFELLESVEFDMQRVMLVNRTLDASTQQPWVDAGCMIAFDGFMTYEQRADLREAAAAVPLQQLLCASGEPDIAPEPIATSPGGSEDTVFVAGKLAEARNATTREDFIPLYDALHENAKRFFGM